MTSSLHLPAALALVCLVYLSPPCAAQAAVTVVKPTEKELRADYKKSYRSKDPTVRIEAVGSLLL